MLKIIYFIILSLFSISSFAEVTSIEWVDKSQTKNQTESDMIDISLKGTLHKIDRDYNENVVLDEEPFPKYPIEKNWNVFSFKQNTVIDVPFPYISQKYLNKIYSSKTVTNSFADAVSDQCHPYYLDHSLSSTNDFSSYNKKLKYFFKKCDRKLVNTFRNKYADMLKLSTKKYKIFNNEGVHPFKIKFNNKESVEGFLALKKNKKRPMIIIKCGVFCNGKSSGSNNALVSTLYDSGPFHVLMLANHTGSRNIKQNNRVNIGGFIEGQEIIKVAKWVKNTSYFKDYVSEVHVLGLSLGGSAALFSGIYNDHLDEKLISSVLGYCPVTSIKNAVYDVTAKGVLGLGVSYIVHKLIKDNYKNIPYISKHYNVNKRFRIRNMKRMSRNLAQLNVEYLNELDNRKFMPPFTNVRINSVEDYFYYNEYKNHLESLQTPTFIWASKNDPVVKHKRNSLDLARSNANPNLQILSTKKGGHCAINESYGWYTVSKIFNNFFLKHSPSLVDNKQILQDRINFSQPDLNSREMFAGAQFLALPKSSNIIVRYKIYTGSKYGNPFYAPKNQFRYIRKQIKFSDLPFPLSVPKNDTEAQVLTRWLNSNVHFKVNDRLFNLSKNKATHLEWTSFE